MKTANVSRIPLKPIAAEQYCGDYCGVCPACLQLDRWLKQTNHGHRKTYKSTIETKSPFGSTNKAIKEALNFNII